MSRWDIPLFIFGLLSMCCCGRAVPRYDGRRALRNSRSCCCVVTSFRRGRRTYAHHVMFVDWFYGTLIWVAYATGAAVDGNP